MCVCMCVCMCGCGVCVCVCGVCMCVWGVCVCVCVCVWLSESVLHTETHKTKIPFSKNFIAGSFPINTIKYLCEIKLSQEYEDYGLLGHDAASFGRRYRNIWETCCNSLQCRKRRQQVPTYQTTRHIILVDCSFDTCGIYFHLEYLFKYISSFLTLYLFLFFTSVLILDLPVFPLMLPSSSFYFVIFLCLFYLFFYFHFCL